MYTMEKMPTGNIRQSCSNQVARIGIIYEKQGDYKMTGIKYWQYDASGKLNGGERVTAIDPVATEKAGEKRFFPVPVNGTTVQPPDGREGYNIIWTGSAWEYQEKPKDPEPPTEEERWASLTSEQKAEELRAKRDGLIEDVMWRVERYQTQKALGVSTADSDDNYRAVLAYLEELRNVPEQAGFPETVQWPVLAV